MNTSQYQVAFEFGYSKRLIKKLLIKKKYETAGDLIEELEKLEFERIREGHEIEEDQSETEEEKMEEEVAENITSSNSTITNANVDDSITIVENAKQLTLREETEILYSKSICLMCQRAKRTRVILPCSHLTHCENCNPKVRRCPRSDCRLTVDFTISTYM